MDRSRLQGMCETARLIGVDPQAYLLQAVYAAIAKPGIATFPEDLTVATASDRHNPPASPSGNATG